MGSDNRVGNRIDIFIYQGIDIRWIRSLVVAEINAECGAERSEIAFGRPFLCFVDHISELRDHDRTKDGYDRNHNHQLNQRVAGLNEPKIMFESDDLLN